MQLGLGAAQAVQYAGLLVACGLAAFVVTALPLERATEAARQRCRRLVLAAAAAGLLGAVGVGVLAPSGSGLHLTAAWVGAGLALTAILARPASRSWHPRLVVGAALATLLGPVLSGHSRSHEPLAPVLLADAVHLGAAALWTGGLAGLAVVLPALLPRARLAAGVLARFSTVAGAALLAVALTGALLTWRYLGDWTALVATAYGRVLLAKVALVGVVAVVAAWNRRVLLPRVEGAAGHRDRLAAGALLRRAVALEATGLVGAAVLAGFLVGLAPR
ncbi:putative copper export protein [Nocardioides massiliensis]|uniref:Copper export protein n=2 Tax=Nocardioides massiliensis TaxID=1325935 RepID=A0ABT9NNV0_9ACTN|nr:CopD family protein [Nocardioides massiliensis]MDP9822088.1 putative copper export protein [Nocardioides massiliensis]